MFGRGVGAVYTVHRIFETVSDFRATFRGMCQVALGRTVVLYVLGSTAREVATAGLSGDASLDPSRASGVLQVLRRGKLVIERLNGRSHQRVCFRLSSANGRQIDRLRISGIRVPRLLGPLFGWARFRTEVYGR